MIRNARIDHDVTVVIPTLGREILRRSLGALESGSSWPERVIVVDQGSQDHVRVMLEETKGRSFDTLWIPSSQRGRAAAVNRGTERVTTRFVAVTDDDCLPDMHWVERIGARLRAHPDVIITGRVEAEDGDVMIYVTTNQTEVVQRRPAIRFDRLSGGNMAAAKAVIDRLGGLDEHESLRTSEDGEFAYRALRAGVAIMYAPDLVITHLGWRDQEQRAAQYQGYARSQGGFYGKYLRRGDLFILLRTAAHLARALRRWTLGAIRGQDELARNGRAYVMGLLPGIVAGWRRETSQ